MMFYTTVGGWMISYIIKSAQGAFDTTAPDVVFADMLANPVEQVGWMLVTVVLGFLVCSLGLQKGVERDHQSHDELFVSHHDRVVYSQRHPRWSGSKASNFILCRISARCSQNRLGQLWRGGVCRYGTVLLHLEFGHFCHGHFWLVYREGAAASWRSVKYRRSGHARCADGRTDYFPSLLCLRREPWGRPGIGICHSAECIQPDVGQPSVGSPVLSCL